MKIIHNLLEPSVFKDIQNFIFNSNDFPLYYHSEVGKKSDKSDFMFTHLFYINDKQNSDFMSLIVNPILDKLKPKKLIRVKLNCYTKKEKHIHTAYHTDLNYPHKVALFSLNTCNGYTYFKKSKKKVYSVENDCVLFNGLLEHCSVNQTDENLRINININYE
jgi:hypothetical protein